MPVLTDGTNRTARREAQLGPHRIPAGTMVWVPFGATFAGARSWNRAGEYLPVRARAAGGLPRCCALYQQSRRILSHGSWGAAVQERWDDANAEYCQHPGGEASATLPSSSQEAGRAKRFLPFSLGRRDCVGQSLARMNMTATIATLLSEFSFCLADEVLLLLLSAGYSLHGCRCCTQQSAGGQMGSVTSVRERATSGLLTLQPANGLLMHCLPRGPEVAAGS